MPSHLAEMPGTTPDLTEINDHEVTINRESIKLCRLCIIGALFLAFGKELLPYI